VLKLSNAKSEDVFIIIFFGFLCQPGIKSCLVVLEFESRILLIPIQIPWQCATAIHLGILHFYWCFYYWHIKTAIFLEIGMFSGKFALLLLKHENSMTLNWHLFL